MNSVFDTCWKKKCNRKSAKLIHNGMVYCRKHMVKEFPGKFPNKKAVKAAEKRVAEYRRRNTGGNNE